MKELKSVNANVPTTRYEVDFGAVRLKIKEYLDKNDITRNQLSVATGIKYQTVDRYYKSECPVRIDCELIAKMCFSLGCDLGDIIEYKKPEKN